ncbi:bifunctional folylpolyglutamate synthase/dihydrofolate synthase [Anaerobutyricum soehngenii]|uniref:bifunctional folylpolyglutamate synthase/dihydrofolate synthase n=1 Tax=Anaerobutyricum soehngenii TaxID=105843 RepID=UPI001ADD62D3|nr:folylpolyglutamate synthase/dihydrofolate synthase family protein [Anaerobutyricum soehngenii]MBP0059910.1 bifunctional folylpolyglutamate synthase/dihydrofolate synthase [Anaerobutyricum soehngenii]
MNYISLIEELKKRGSVPGLDAIEGLLEELGHPEDNLKIVHIAGTNGKGSIFAYLSSILIAAGFKVGRYISPTISCYEERFQINGEYIIKDKLARLYNIVEEAMKREEEKTGLKPTLFEVETAISFLYFKEEKVDYALIEVGMGGRMDATNVIRHPELTVISSISYDHQAFLGDTLEEIAWQKAGIIKESCPVVLSENSDEVCKVIEQEATKKKVKCIEIKPTDYEVLSETPYGSTFLWKEQRYETKLPGRHQVSNAVTALAASEYLFRKDYEKNNARKAIAKKLDEMNVKSAQQGGIIRTCWPGRLEVLKKEPLFYRDGAHNPDGAKKLAAFLQKYFTNKKIIYIMGVLKDKEYKKMLRYLMPMAKEVYVFKPKNERGLSAQILVDTIKEVADVSVTIESDVNAAVFRALDTAKPDDVLVACGSLSFMEEMEDIL